MNIYIILQLHSAVGKPAHIHSISKVQLLILTIITMDFITMILEYINKHQAIIIYHGAEHV